MTEEQTSLGWLSSILDILLKECPWDSVQTIETLRYLTIEEVYELSEAITAAKPDEISKELGDLFMHLMFYCKLAEKKGLFSSSDAIDGICKKLIARHPHIALPDRKGIIHNPQAATTPKWEEVKMREGRKSALEGVPDSMPSLVKAIRIQEKAAGMGFEFPNAEMAKAKVDEEYGELLEALDGMTQNGNDSSKRHAEEELGDLLFAIVKWAHLNGLNADDALSRTNMKFKERFSYIEQEAHKDGLAVNQLTLDEMTTLWNRAKEPLT